MQAVPRNSRMQIVSRAFKSVEVFSFLVQSKCETVWSSARSYRAYGLTLVNFSLPRSIPFHRPCISAIRFSLYVSRVVASCLFSLPCNSSLSENYIRQLLVPSAYSTDLRSEHIHSVSPQPFRRTLEIRFTRFTNALYKHPLALIDTIFEKQTIKGGI